MMKTEVSLLCLPITATLMVTGVTGSIDLFLGGTTENISDSGDNFAFNTKVPLPEEGTEDLRNKPLATDDNRNITVAISACHQNAKNTANFKNKPE